MNVFQIVTHRAAICGYVRDAWTVASDSDGRPVLDPKGNVLSPPTSVSGIVQHANTAAPIVQAEIKLPASALSIRSNNLGPYWFSAIEASMHSARITAPGFVRISQQVTLNPGRACRPISISHLSRP